MIPHFLGQVQRPKFNLFLLTQIQLVLRIHKDDNIRAQVIAFLLWLWEHHVEYSMFCLRSNILFNTFNIVQLAWLGQFQWRPFKPWARTIAFSWPTSHNYCLLVNKSYDCSTRYRLEYNYGAANLSAFPSTNRSFSLHF